MNSRENLIREAYENFPECSLSIRCVSWKYDAFIFKFIDEEDGKKYTVTLKDALRGLDIFEELVKEGKLHFYGLSPDFMEDTSSWDAPVFDAALQCAIFGEVIYG